MPAPQPSAMASPRRRLVPLGVALLATVAAGCVVLPDREPAPPQRITHYTVLPGDTLYGIAFRLGLDHRDLARWNGLDDPSRIYPGQRLVLSGAPAGTAAVVRRGDGGGDTARPATPPKPQGASAPRVAAGAAAGAAGAAKSPAAPPTPGPSPARAAVASSHRWQWPARADVVAGFGDPGSVGRGLDLAGREGDSVVAAADGRVVYSGSGLIGYGNLVIIKHDEAFLSAYGHNASLLVSQGQEVRGGQRIARMGLGPGKRPLLHFEIRVDGKPVDPLTYLPPRD